MSAKECSPSSSEQTAGKIPGGTPTAFALGDSGHIPNPAARPPPNRLIREKSPYLQQHARNPVDWYPWGEEAFAKARREGKPIFLSVGYSTCHWCHVMERQSFENEETAAILNRNFVSIKVDREERPDIDRVYMTYVQAATGQGGWPMSVWLTPGLKPFLGGTYYPPESRWGRPGFKDVLLRVAEAWAQDRDRLIAAADEVAGQLRQADAAAPGAGTDLDASLLDRTYEALKASYDPQYGGFGGVPKFPRPAAPVFLLRYYARSLRSASAETARNPAQDALDMTLFTLRKMADGGMHDCIGGGFHRYSVDERWHLPHFEKMLYDQGQLVGAYLDAWQITHDDFFADVAGDILDYVRRDMTDPQGGFYSAEDADSPLPANPRERAEGAFYVWTAREITGILDGKANAVFKFYYGVDDSGNVTTDPLGELRYKNILIVSHSVEETASRFGMTPESVRDTLAGARARLFDAREKRPRPHLDDKIITAWNGLMISAFARAYQALRDDKNLASAAAAAQFIRRRLYREKDGILLRRYRDGESAIEGYADDYAFLTQGLLDLYEASFETEFLTWALALQKKQDELFWDNGAGGYFNTSGKDKTIFLRMKESYDSAEPSPNSVAVLNLLRMARMTDDDGLINKAERTLSAFGYSLKDSPQSMPQMMAGFDFFLDKPMQVVIAGKPGAKDTVALLREVHSRFIPNKIILLADGGGGQLTLAEHLDFIKGVSMLDGKATAYICEDYACSDPITDVTALGRIMRKGR